MTNREFADAVGCSTTMASRMRNGLRLPSVSTLLACIRAFDLDEGEAIRASVAPAVWGRYLRDTVFSRARVGAGAQVVEPRPAGWAQNSTAGPIDLPEGTIRVERVS